MAWTTPPTFADGDYLTAAKLNALSNNQEHLYGMSRQVNPGFPMRVLNDSDNSTDTVTGGAVMHLTNTFFYRLYFTGTADFIYIRYNNVQIWNVNNPTPGVLTGTVDIASLGLTIGAFYWMSVSTRAPAGQTSSVEVQRLCERW